MKLMDKNKLGFTRVISETCWKPDSPASRLGPDPGAGGSREKLREEEREESWEWDEDVQMTSHWRLSESTCRDDGLPVSWDGDGMFGTLLLLLQVEVGRGMDGCKQQEFKESIYIYSLSVFTQYLKSRDCQKPEGLFVYLSWCTMQQYN